MQDGGHIPIAGLLRGRLRSPEGGIPRTSETRGGLGRPGSPFLGRSRVSTSGRLRRLWAAGHKAWRRLRTRRGLGTRPVWGPSRWLGLRLPAPLASALAFARGLILRHMRRAGVGCCSGLPIRPASSLRRIIAQVPGCFRARGPRPAPVGVVPPPLGPSFGGGTRRATARAVVVPGGGTVATTSGGGGATGGASLRPWLVISLRGTVGPAVSRTVVTAGTFIIPAPAAPSVSPTGGGGSSVGGF